MHGQSSYELASNGFWDKNPVIPVEAKCESGELDSRERSIGRKPISRNHSDVFGWLELHGSTHTDPTATPLPQIASLLEFP